MSFNPGDKVVVNGGLLAEIVSYDEGINLVTYKSTPPGGGTEMHTDHINQTRIELIPELPFPKHEAPEDATPADGDDAA